jgi:hypothetical protein
MNKMLIENINFSIEIINLWANPNQIVFGINYKVKGVYEEIQVEETCFLQVNLDYNILNIQNIEDYLDQEEIQRVKNRILLAIQNKVEPQEPSVLVLNLE